jgi:hypothetical protein
MASPSKRHVPPEFRSSKSFAPVFPKRGSAHSAAERGAMMTSSYRVRPLRGLDLNEMQRANLRALLRQLRREHSWTVIAQLLSFRRAYIRDFFDGIEPGNMALARGIAAASELDLDVALDGRFTITTKGVKPIKRRGS